jgi:hypothetical protein
MSNDTRDDGGPAFPIPGLQHDESFNGMTLRDYFAGLAMQAAATNPVGANGFSFEQRAEWAYQQADAMLKARRS